MGAWGAAYNPETGAGLTPADHQAIIANHWTNADKSPMVGGGIVTGTSTMGYAYTAGSGVVKTAFGAVEVNWPSGQTALVGTPSVARTDTVYVDAIGQVNVAQGGSVPANVCVLGRPKLPAGATSTINAVNTWDRIYALPYGATLGWRCMKIETYTDGQWAVQQKIDWMSDSFFVPTDRHVQMQMAQCICGTNASNSSDMCFGSFRYGLHIDGALVRVWEMGFDRRKTVNEFYTNLEVSAGRHTIKVERELVWGNQGPQHFGSGNNIWQPAHMGVLDMGVKE